MGIAGVSEIERVPEIVAALRHTAYPTSDINWPQGHVAVIADFHAGLFGGPISQLLRCLSAIKVCEELKRRGVDATPVCWIRADTTADFSPHEIHLLDHCYRLHRISLNAPNDLHETGTGTAQAMVCDDRTEHLLDEIEAIFPSSVAVAENNRAFAALRKAFAPGSNFISANARWTGDLLNHWGMLTMKPDESDSDTVDKELRKTAVSFPLMQCQKLPVAIIITESRDDSAGITAASLWKHAGVTRPLFWPRAQVTITSARINKFLRRYDLDFTQLFNGSGNIMESVCEKMQSDVPERLQWLETEVRDALKELKVFDAHDQRSARDGRERGERILYQFEKLRRHTDGALVHKKQTAINRIRKACDFLTPHGRRQEDVLGLLQIPLRYGTTGLQTLYENLDITNFDNQLVEID